MRIGVRDGQVIGLECVQVILGDLDASGRPAPASLPGSEFFVLADQVIKAIGQEKPPIANALGLATKHGYIDVNADFETNILNIFAGGDCIRSSGKCSTVMAVEDGKLAALAIDKKLAASARTEAP